MAARAVAVRAVAVVTGTVVVVTVTVVAGGDGGGGGGDGGGGDGGGGGCGRRRGRRWCGVAAKGWVAAAPAAADGGGSGGGAGRIVAAKRDLHGVAAARRCASSRRGSSPIAPRDDRAVGAPRGKGGASREDFDKAAARRCAGPAVGSWYPTRRSSRRRATRQRRSTVEDFGKAAARRCAAPAGAAIPHETIEPSACNAAKAAPVEKISVKPLPDGAPVPPEPAITPRDDRAVGMQRGKGVPSREDFGKAAARRCAGTAVVAIPHETIEPSACNAAKA